MIFFVLTWWIINEFENTKGYIKYVLIFENRTLGILIRKLGPIKYSSQPCNNYKSCGIKNGFYPGDISTTAWYSQTTRHVHQRVRLEHETHAKCMKRVHVRIQLRIAEVSFFCFLFCFILVWCFFHRTMEEFIRYKEPFEKQNPI